ncbi:non-ribosomal peptide synthetase [Frankia sp. R43]|uniref:non-ribosomal peptide synthetase n=1 Tax=Frankia sp. R43 TaxID=269536 RepID=UPI001F3C1EEE|nr:non-ribosomal peptide synthetase [Frankia sp. R43]
MSTDDSSTVDLARIGDVSQIRGGGQASQSGQRRQAGQAGPGGGATDSAAARRRELARRRLAAQGLAGGGLSGGGADSGGAENGGAGGGVAGSGLAGGGGAPVARPLSAGQRRMWSLQNLDPTTTGYNVRIALDLTGPVRAEAIAAAASAVVARHDILRTTYRMGDDGAVRQVVHPLLAPLVERIDLTGLPAGERATRAGELCTALAATPFDLAADSPLRIGLYRTGADALTLIVVAHHIAWDDSTTTIFFGELVAFLQDPAAVLPPPPQHADLALAPAPSPRAGLEFWRETLNPAPERLILPELTGTARAAGGTDQTFALGARMAARVRDSARESGATSFMVLLAAVAVLLRRYGGARDLVIGVPVVNRDLPGGDQVIGYLGNTVPLRMRVEGTETFAELVAQARQVCLASYAHQDVDLDDIGRAADPERTRGDAALFNVVLSLRASVLDPFRAVGLRAHRRPVPGDDARFDLTLAVETDGDAMSVEANHPRTDAARELVARMLGHLDRILDVALTWPDRALHTVDLLSDEERHQLLVAWNNTATTAPAGAPGTPGHGAPGEAVLLPARVAAQAAATPDAPAVLADGDRLSYRELDRRANQLARLLAGHGAGPESTVALGLTRSTEMVIALLAVARAGACYVPVDPGYPADRVRRMLTDSRPVLLITRSADVGTLPEVPGLTALLLDGEDTRSRLAGLPDHDVTDADRTAPLLPDHPAYVIYTSGSTGVPKGVVVAHRALANHLDWAVRCFPGLAGHTLMHSSISFDFSVTPLLATLTCGGAVELCEDSPDAIARAQGAATFLKITPSHLPLLPEVRFATEGPRTLVIAGEELRGEALGQWARPADEQFAVINEYGPTETTVGALLHPVTDGLAGAVPVGAPVDNTVGHLLDEGLRLVPVGVAGELYLGGSQLARGYLNRPGLSATRFVADPYGPPGARLYRTGDLMRRLPTGALQFLGRADEQIKIRGYRVELGEIESVLLGHPGVAQATVAARTDGPGGRYLAGYLVPADGAEPDPAGLRAHAAAVLPDHMVPATLTFLPALPLSPSGKVDRRALPAPRFGAGAADPADPAGVAGPVPDREPANAAEATLAGLFAEIVGVPSARLDESFFELGGDSILAIRLVSRARAAGLRFTPRDVFAHRTVEALAAAATVVPDGAGSGGTGAGSAGTGGTGAGSVGVGSAAVPAGDTTGTGPVALTPIMRSFAERGPLGDAHRMSVVVDLPQPPPDGVLEQALQALLDRHDMLRAQLDRSGDPVELTVRPVGSVRAAEVLRRVTVDPAAGDRAVADRTAAELAVAASRLAPAQGRVLQAVLLDAGPAAAAKLLLVAHHLVVDGVSWRIIVPDLATAVQAAVTGASADLPPVATSFRTWAAGLTRAAAARTDEAARWHEVLAGPDALLGRRHADPALDTWSTVRTITVHVDPDVAGPVLTSVPAAFFAGVDDVLLAALALALASWTAGRGDAAGRAAGRSALVLLEGHGRQEEAVAGSDLSRTVGWFTSQHPVRLDTTGIDLAGALAAGPSAGAVLRRVKEHLRSLPDHGIGYGLLRHLHPGTEPGLAARPVPQIGFNYLGRFEAPSAQGWRVDAAGLDAAYGADMPLPAGLVVNAVAEQTAAGPRLRAHWMYAEGIFDATGVTDLAHRWRDALEAIARHAAGADAGGRTPSDLSLVSLNQDQLDALEAMWRTT